MANKKNKEINHTNLVTIKSITDNQKLVFDSWKKGKNQFLFGAAGTGKTFISLFLALKDVLDLKKPYDKVVLVRSLIPTREIGFLPGDVDDKLDPWIGSIVDNYKSHFKDMTYFEMMRKKGQIEVAPWHLSEVELLTTLS